MPVEIPLTRGFVAIIDEEDAEKVSRYKWRVLVTATANYAVTTITVAKYRRTCLLMHRLILLDGAKTDQLVDHINGNGLDNRRGNLRLATVAQNGWNKRAPICTNTSGATGVLWSKKDKKWRVNIFVGGKRRSLGRYCDKDDAIAARKAGEKLYYGEYAPL